MGNARFYSGRRKALEKIGHGQLWGIGYAKGSGLYHFHVWLFNCSPHFLPLPNNFYSEQSVHAQNALLEEPQIMDLNYRKAEEILILGTV